GGGPGAAPRGADRSRRRQACRGHSSVRPRRGRLSSAAACAGQQQLLRRGNPALLGTGPPRRPDEASGHLGEADRRGKLLVGVAGFEPATPSSRTTLPSIEPADFHAPAFQRSMDVLVYFRSFRWV